MRVRSDVIAKVAQEIFVEYKYISDNGDRITWEDLHEDSKANWCHVARVAINTYNQHKGDQ